MENDEGWARPSGFHKWHYFIEARPLCELIIVGADVALVLEQGNDNSPNNCSFCRETLTEIRTQKKEESYVSH